MPAEPEEFDLGMDNTGTVRPDLFITPDVIGIAVPEVLVREGR